MMRHDPSLFPAGFGPWSSPRARGFDRDLPPEAPLAMPVQDVDRAPVPTHRIAPPAAMRWRRGALIAGSGAIGLVASCGIGAPLALDGFDLLDQITVLVSLALLSWISFGFLSALAGLVVLAAAPRSAPAAPRRLPRDRVAVLVPVYGEEVAPLADRLARVAASLGAVDAADRFDLFVLSDSELSAEPAERAMVCALRARAACAIYYRRRATNEGRKPGNIAEWVARFGAAYPAMIVLDADSVMTGDAMLRLAAGLEDDTTLGLIQTNPRLTRARTIFARWQQFAAALYGPIAGAGLAWWSGDEATFWGHNAILRTAAFAESCGLPRLSGPEPMGGHILSHDMVEAALLRRRGWRARLMLLDGGSYEESPPTLIDHGVRDRRWCQGNLQHLRLLDMAGLHWISRLQLLMGASAYLASPLWLLLLVLGMAQAMRTGAPISSGTPAWLIALTLLLLFGPKLLALAWAAMRRESAAALGGWRAIARGVALDVPLSIIAAPITMASQCLAIVDILAGRPSGWRTQRRATSGIRLGEALDRYRWHMLLGLAFWTLSLSEFGGALWGLPVALGLLGAPLVATITSRADWGAALARNGVFAVDPGETDRTPDIPTSLTRSITGKSPSPSGEGLGWSLTTQDALGARPYPLS